MKKIQLRNSTIWDRCRSCGRTWDVAPHSSRAQCRGCRRLEKPIDNTIQPSHFDYNFLSSNLKKLILFEETKNKYSYQVSNLSYGSPSPIVHLCPECNLPKENTPFKLFLQGKNLRHTKCKVKQTRKTNLERYGVLNSCNQKQLVQSRLEKKNREITQSFQKENYKVLNIERNSCREIIVHFICPQGHIHKITYRAWKVGGQRCGKCFANNGKITIEIVRKSFEDEKYCLHTTIYEDNNTELFYTCPKGHNKSTSWKIWERGHRCPVCNPASTSKGELEVKEAFKEFNPVKTRTIVSPYELDVYFSDHKLAIEYCGLYWHSDGQERIKPSYHYRKMKNCNKKGVRLITIFEDEWQDKKSVCISRIKNALGITGASIFARQCEVKIVPKEESSMFFRQNHLQGFAKSTRITYGLYCNKELVYAASVGLPSRPHTSKGKNTLELKRMAPKLDTTVVGGASRLFKHICIYAKNNGCEEIKSYCDMRWGTGNVYVKLGMKLQHQTHFTPHYTNGKIRQRNQSFAGKEIPKGWYKIYDCGHQTWVYNL